MSGHSKWATIKRAKGKTDAERGKVFTKLGKEIAVAVKMGGADPNANPRLRDAVTKAKQNNMPNDNITRSIKKASGELSTINYEDMTYEGYGIGGSAVIVECLTDNKNRTVGDIRHYFDKYGGSLGSTGCVSYMFNKKGVLTLEKTDKTDEDTVTMLALEANAEDVVDDDEAYQIITEPSKFGEIKEILESKGLVFVDAAVQYVPQNYVDLNPEQLTTFVRMLDMLEDLDDVQEVWHNVNLPLTEEE
ncbi:MAG: YebC/PmpR family DNA-binding transcriptional regulator [Christensenellaceae bacterium]|jgi:YebC/PmpR family DNA-binding regulatory protein|nr:YebC/PmpR family DNA-binding transcriptional regulator [Christensenellaceae bacterium]